MLNQIGIALLLLWIGFALASRRSRKDTRLAGHALLFGVWMLVNIIKTLWNQTLLYLAQIQVWFWAILPDTRSLYWLGFIIATLVFADLIIVLVWLWRAIKL